MSAAPDSTVEVVSRDTIPVDLVDPDPDQPRRSIDPAALEELRASILANGLVCPILVRPIGGRYRIVAGERRWRAVTLLGWTDIPAEVRDVDDDDARWLQLVENLNRDDLSPVEEARAYKGMLDRGETQRVVAERVGKTRSYIAQKLRLLDLPAAVSLLLDQGALTEGHVRQLLRFKGFYRGHKAAASSNGFTESDARAIWGDLHKPEARCAMTFVTVRVARPLDWPHGYPFDGKDRPLVADATQAHWIEIAQRQEVIYWEQTAYWYAALTAAYDLSVADLAAAVNRWVEQIQAAVLYVDVIGGAEVPEDPGGAAEWFAYRSDLRHAGLTDDHQHLVADASEALLGSDGEGPGMALPSIAQVGSPGRDRYLELTGAER